MCIAAAHILSPLNHILKMLLDFYTENQMDYY